MVLWSVIGLLAVAAAVTAWTTMRKGTTEPPKSAAVDSSLTAPPVDKPDTGKIAVVTGSPQISFPETEHNFGTIAQGAKVSHKFVVRNTGDAPLRLIRAQGT